MDDKRRGKNGGRHSTITPAKLALLNEGYSNGMTDAEACLFAGVSLDALYRYTKRNPSYRDYKETLKRSPVMRARQNIVNAIDDGNIDVSKWYLERKARDEFSTRSDVQITTGDVTRATDAIRDALRGFIDAE